jgi:hypothetical protein
VSWTSSRQGAHAESHWIADAGRVDRRNLIVSNILVTVGEEDFTARLRNGPTVAFVEQTEGDLPDAGGKALAHMFGPMRRHADDGRWRGGRGRFQQSRYRQENRT